MIAAMVLAMLVSTPAAAAAPADSALLLELARTDLSRFAETLTAGASSTRAKAVRIVSWYAENLDWTATDYQRRTVEEILRRGGGNCDELARVAVATMEALGMKMRRVREINLHRESPRRQQSAEARVREHGASSSVFGRRHNDHVWLEIHDLDDDTWFPADPSLGIVGEPQWVKARLGFGERVTIDPSAGDMIAPFAIFAVGSDGQWIDRGPHYLLTTFDRSCGGRLSRLPSWKAWAGAVDLLGPKARAAFRGEYDLHRSEDEILRAHEIYARLRSELLAAAGEASCGGS